MLRLHGVRVYATQFVELRYNFRLVKFNIALPAHEKIAPCSLSLSLSEMIFCVGFYYRTIEDQDGPSNIHGL